MGTAEIRDRGEGRRMDGEDEGGGPRQSKRFGGKGGEVDYKTTAGTAWSHSYLNQKPWHPLSYPNQRRKWIAEQSEAQRRRRSDEVAREFAQEQEFFRQTALISKKEKEKVEMMKAVSFMYVRPPGYNAESAKAAELEDERRKEENLTVEDKPPDDGSTSMLGVINQKIANEEKKGRPTDVFGRALPTEQEFEVLKNAPRLDTGMPARVKPFGVEVRNVKCVRCSMYGHQSGDRECPLKDAITANEESRLKRDDPLTAIVAQTDPGEPLKWEMKHKPGMSPPRGGFRPDDPNQQIVAEDIFDEYGGFLSGGGIPDLLVDFSTRKPSRKRSKKKSKCKDKLSKSKHGTDFDDNEVPVADTDSDAEKEKKRLKRKGKNEYSLNLSVSYHSDSDGKRRQRRKEKDCRYQQKRYSSSSDHSSEDERTKKKKRGKTSRHVHASSSDHSSEDERTKKKKRGKTSRHVHDTSSDDSRYDHRHRRSKHR